MKWTFLFALFLALSTNAQEHWTVQLNSKTLLAASKEDEAANTVKVSDLKKGSLIVTYVPAVAEGQRKRKLMVVDANDNELYAKENLSLVIPVKTLKQWKQSSAQLKIYTIPVLGEEGAAVRLRRVHLCTILFE